MKNEFRTMTKTGGRALSVPAVAALLGLLVALSGCGGSSTDRPSGPGASSKADATGDRQKFSDRCKHDGPVFVQPGAAFTEAEVVDALCIKVDFARDGFYLDDSCQVGVLENARKVAYHKKQRHYANAGMDVPSMIINNSESLGFLFDGSDNCAVLIKQALKELDPANGASTTTIIAPDWEAERENLRTAVRAWGHATAPAEICALFTPDYQREWLKKRGKSGRCADVMPRGNDVTFKKIILPKYPNVDGDADVVALDARDTNRVTFSLRDGHWLVAAYSYNRTPPGSYGT